MSGLEFEQGMYREQNPMPKPIYPIQGSMYSADFTTNTLIFKMSGEYYAKAGKYVILTLEQYERLVEPLNQDEIIQRMRRSVPPEVI